MFFRHFIAICCKCKKCFASANYITALFQGSPFIIFYAGTENPDFFQIPPVALHDQPKKRKQDAEAVSHPAGGGGLRDAGLHAGGAGYEVHLRNRGGAEFPLTGRWTGELFYLFQDERDKRKHVVGVGCVYAF